MEKPNAELKGLYRTEVVAKLLGITDRRVRQLAQEGIFKATEISGVKGFDLFEVVPAFVTYQVERNKPGDEKALKELKLKAEIALKESQGELHQMKNEIAKGNYLARDEVKLDYGRFLLSFKKFAMSIPSRVAGQLSGRLEPLEVRAVEKDIQDEVTKLLSAFVVAGVSEEDTVSVIVLPKKGRPKKR